MKKGTILAVVVVVIIVVSGGVWMWLNSPSGPEVPEPTWTWTEMSPSAEPPARNGNCFIYDAESDVTVLFGGDTGPGGVTLNDTWAYDYDQDTWMNKTTDSGPPELSAFNVAYDSESDKIIVFGGWYTPDGEAILHRGDTWAYDYNTNTWENMSPAASPPMRRYSSTAYDSGSDRVIIFGGVLATGGTTGDTWAYDYNTNTWEEMNPTSKPSSRFYSLMAYDSESDKIILFSGAGLGMFTDTWAYDYNNDTWENMNPDDHGMGGAAQMAYDPVRDLCITFGGIDEDDEVYSETWTYDYNINTWSNLSINICPCARERAYLTYNTESNVTLLYGGLGEDWYDSILGDTWSLDYEENGDMSSMIVSNGWQWVLVAVVRENDNLHHN